MCTGSVRLLLSLFDAMQVPPTQKSCDPWRPEARCDAVFVLVVVEVAVMSSWQSVCLQMQLAHSNHADEALYLCPQLAAWCCTPCLLMKHPWWLFTSISSPQPMYS